MKTYIVGHKNPDTDSVVSAVALSELKKAMGKDFIPSVAGDLNKETLFVLEKFGFTIPKLISTGEKKVILVDHNELSQIHENVSTDQIIGVFDHHKLGGLSTAVPISVTVRPVGSTATIIFGSYEKNGIELSPEIAGILLSGIVSDTLYFSSPTTMDRDKEVAEILTKISGVNVKNLADDMFAAKSDISDVSTDDLLRKDYKIFEMKGKKVGIGVWETVLPDAVISRKDKILEQLKQNKISDKLDYIYFVVVDIVSSQSTFFIIDDAEKVLAEKSFGGTVRDETLVAPGVVSRKKQIAPPLENNI